MNNSLCAAPMCFHKDSQITLQTFSTGLLKELKYTTYI